MGCVGGFQVRALKSVRIIFAISYIDPATLQVALLGFGNLGVVQEKSPSWLRSFLEESKALLVKIA